MYEMSQQHPVWVAENHVNPCNSVEIELSYRARQATWLGGIDSLKSIPGLLKSL